MESGIYNILFGQYLALDRVSNSFLNRLSKVPALAKIKTEATPAMTFGTAFHSFILEPDKFSHQVAVCPKCDKRTKAGKETFSDFTTESAGKVVISIDEFEAIQSMRKSISRHPAASRLLSEGIAEQSVLFTDHDTGIECKARPDWITSENVVVDLKTTRDASEYGFLRSVLNFRYYQQAAMYLDALNIVSDTEYTEFVFVAIEVAPPFRVETYSLSTEFLEFGYREYHKLLGMEKRFRELDFYPNYANEGIVELAKPKYL